MINPKYKNVFMAPGRDDSDRPPLPPVSEDPLEDPVDSTPESIEINGHTIASKMRKVYGTTGQTVGTAMPKSNKGGSGGTMVVHVDKETYQQDKTWQEIHDAAAAGQDVRLVWVVNDDVILCNLARVFHLGGVEYPYHVLFYMLDAENKIAPLEFACDAADGYPKGSSK